MNSPTSLAVFLYQMCLEDPVPVNHPNLHPHPTRLLVNFCLFQMYSLKILSRHLHQLIGKGYHH